MSWANFHTHCKYCDGFGEPEEYINEAINAKSKAIGFSSHAPLPFNTDWTMKRNVFEEYCNKIQLLKKAYLNDIDIYLGLEIDYILGAGKLYSFNFADFDYIIGSVHFLGSNNSDKFWSVDYSEEEFVEGVKRDFNGDIKKAVEAYYCSIQEMAKNQGINIIGHLDIIKKNNAQNKFFSESDSWYKNLVLDTLKHISKTELIVEVNTGGIIRKKTDSLYPSNWILEKCYEYKIPITLSSDAHMPEHITARFTEAASILNNIGFKELHILEKTSWRPREFSVNGIK